MRLLLLLLFAFPGSAWADPGWLHPNLTKRECEQVFWKTRGLCFEEFYKQQSSRYEDFVLFELGLVDVDGCKGVTEAYREREAAWSRYKAAECDLLMHCVGPCGSGESADWHGCRASVESQRYERLRAVVETGLDIRGCRFEPNQRTRRFRSETFDLVIEATCPGGRFDCAEIELTGSHRETGRSIELIGKELIARESGEPSFEGYVFEDGGVSYRLLTSGRLLIEDRDSGRTLVDEPGVWAVR